VKAVVESSTLMMVFSKETSSKTLMMVFSQELLGDCLGLALGLEVAEQQQYRISGQTPPSIGVSESCAIDSHLL